MASAWDKAIARNDLYVEQDFERAAYRLISHQVLSEMDSATRKDYFLVHMNLQDFIHVMKPLGVEIFHDEHYRFIVAKPKHVLNVNRASKQTTLLVLVLASIHHRVRSEGQEGDFGEAYVNLQDLQEEFRGSTGRELPKTGELRAQVAELNRWGVASEARNIYDDGQPFRIMIHPAISTIVSKEWLNQLDAFRQEAEKDEEEVTVIQDEEGDNVPA